MPEPDRRPWAPLSPPARLASAALVAGLATLPLWAGDYVLTVGSEILIVAIFAASLQFIMSAGAMVSFGHAAYFGLGAYGAALAVKLLGLPMLPALGCGVLARRWPAPPPSAGSACGCRASTSPC